MALRNVPRRAMHAEREGIATVKNQEHLATSSTQLALGSLAKLGYPMPSETLVDLRRHLRLHGAEPLAAVRALMQSHRLLCLGEMHDFSGRFMSAEFVAAAAQGGARWLFIEVDDAQQLLIDEFVRTGMHELLPQSVGGGSAVPMRFQQPYVEMLHAARHAGLRIVAVDHADAGFDRRNQLMAHAVARCLAHPAERGVAVVGQLHLTSRTIFGEEPSMATRLRTSLQGSVVTIGRAVPDAMPEFSVWSNVADVRKPCLMPVAGSPFERLGSTHGHPTLCGADFDQLFFYPAAAVLEATRPWGTG
jgi:hypothetical protein